MTSSTDAATPYRLVRTPGEEALVDAHETAAPRVLTFGEAIVGYGSHADRLATATTFTRFLGGADLNVAVGLSGLGIPAAYVTVLGDDAHGDHVLARLGGLDVRSLVRRAPGSTAVMFKATGGGGDPDVLQLRHGSAFARSADQVLADAVGLLPDVAHLHLTGITLGVSTVARETTFALLDAARVAGCTVSFDPNLRMNLWPDPDEMRAVVNAAAARADVVLPGEAEGRLLTGSTDPEGIAAFYCALGVGETVVKLGERGAFSANAAGELTWSRSFSVSAVDTVGAGDGFAAGHIAGLLGGESAADRLDRAAAVGALVTTRHGDLEAMPSRREVEQLLALPDPEQAAGLRPAGGSSTARRARRRAGPR